MGSRLTRTGQTQGIFGWGKRKKKRRARKLARQKQEDERAYHAVSIDEIREHFSPGYKEQKEERMNQKKLEELRNTLDEFGLEI